jgi:surface protein
MGNMFSNCSSLTSVDLSNFDTSNVTNMEFMFRNCSSLTSIDLSSFDISNVTSMMSMFSGCTNPNLTIYIKDEATKTKIESYYGEIPSTATVVVGSPN